MSTWRPTSASEQPVTTLVNWQAFDVPGDNPAEECTRHFIGLAFESWNEGRVSSPIQEFDAATGQGRSSSGRIYRLQGMPKADPGAHYVWHRWRHINKVSDVVEVTEEVLRAMQAFSSSASS